MVLFVPKDMQMSLLSQEKTDYEHKNKLVDGLSLREYNAFLVNNRDRLIDVFSEIDQESTVDVE